MRGATHRTLAAVLAALAFVWIAISADPPGARAQTMPGADEAACQLAAGPRRAVAKVLDGGTLRLDDGKVVRLMGLIVPRASDAGAPAGRWPPEQQAAAALERLLAGQSVTLAFAGPRTDRYGRILAHVFLERDGARTWVQARMVQGGHARVFAPPDGEACAGLLLAHETAARIAGKGLWANAAYDLRPADRPLELARYAGTFQIVEGTVARVGWSRALVVVTLESLERPGTQGGSSRVLRLVWQRSARVLEGGIPAQRLKGKRLRVRGWVEVRGGPRIEVIAAHQIELAEDRAGATPVPRADAQPAIVPAQE